MPAFTSLILMSTLGYGYERCDWSAALGGIFSDATGKAIFSYIFFVFFYTYWQTIIKDDEKALRSIYFPRMQFSMLTICGLMVTLAMLKV